jgi:WhiB family transcriptional regulator, redox-sensing transcriptional regulator
MCEITDWRTRAACVDADPELFFPEGTSDPAIDRAKRICTDCPVRARCLDWALSHGAYFGIWGGRTEAERHAMRGSEREAWGVTICSLAERWPRCPCHPHGPGIGQRASELPAGGDAEFGADLVQVPLHGASAEE